MLLVFEYERLFEILLAKAADTFKRQGKSRKQPKRRKQEKQELQKLPIDIREFYDACFNRNLQKCNKEVAIYKAFKSAWGRYVRHVPLPIPNKLPDILVELKARSGIIVTGRESTVSTKIKEKVLDGQERYAMHRITTTNPSNVVPETSTVLYEGIVKVRHEDGEISEGDTSRTTQMSQDDNQHMIGARFNASFLSGITHQISTSLAALAGFMSRSELGLKQDMRQPRDSHASPRAAVPIANEDKLSDRAESHSFGRNLSHRTRDERHESLSPDRSPEYYREMLGMALEQEKLDEQIQRLRSRPSSRRTASHEDSIFDLGFRSSSSSGGLDGPGRHGHKRKL